MYIYLCQPVLVLSDFVFGTGSSARKSAPKLDARHTNRITGDGDFIHNNDHAEGHKSMFVHMYVHTTNYLSQNITKIEHGHNMRNENKPKQQ